MPRHCRWPMPASTPCPRKGNCTWRARWSYGIPDNRRKRCARSTCAERFLPREQQEVLRQRALVHGSIGQLAQAIALLREALSLDPEQTESYFWLAYFLLHRQGYREALAAADRLAQLAPEAAEGHLLRAAALQGLKRGAEAQTENALARRQDPALVDRMSSDPVMARLLRVSPQDNIGVRIRQTLTRYWSGRRHTIEHES